MDLGAYARIESIGKIAAQNGIVVPRLRGYRLMKDEPLISAEDIAKQAMDIGVYECKQILRSCAPGCHEYSSRTDRRIKKYMIKGTKTDPSGKQYKAVIGVNWSVVHGKLRKEFKFALKKADRAVRNQLDTFNKYAGRDDVLYIHARVGGGNWYYYDCKELESKPWFLEKVDDSFDDTYCDIYAKIEPIAN